VSGEEEGVDLGAEGFKLGFGLERGLEEGFEGSVCRNDIRRNGSVSGLDESCLQEVEYLR
jgi:hypothetical protein